ncbi:MAG: hypothetical protein ACK50A_10945 [Sphingobacteriaceae bacterium]
MDTIVSAYIKDLTAIWNDNKAKHFNELIQTESSGLELFTSASVSSVTASSTLKDQRDLVIKRNRLEQTIYKKDLGLSLGGGYQENLGTPFVSTDDAVVFRRKFMIGVDWDILKGGLIENRTKIKHLQNDLLFIELSQKQNQSNNNSTIAFYAKVIDSFNKAKLKVLEQRLAMINKQHVIAKTLWELKQLSGDAYIKSMQHKTDILLQGKLYSNYNSDFDQIKNKEEINVKPILVDLDFARVLKFVDSSEVIKDPAATNANYQSNLNSYYQQMSLKAYTRYNYYDVFNNTIVNRNFLSFGLNFSAPLHNTSKERNEIDQINYQLRTMQNDMTANVVNGKNTTYYLLNLFYEYRYKLKQYFNLLEKRKVFEELIRTEVVKQKLYDLEFNPNTAIYLLDDYWSNTIELLDLHQQMYGIILNIHEKVPGLKLSEYIKPIDPNEFVYEFEPKNSRYIYIWSKSFTNHNVEFISDYVRLNNFSDLVISYKNDKAYLSKINDLIKDNPALNAHLMVGQNKLIVNGMQGFLDSLKTNVNLSSFKGLHLDIEPHAMEDFQQNKEQYFASYMKLLDEFKAFCNEQKIQLSVSIPLNYPENVLNKLFTVSDKVFLMAYENVKDDFIQRKIEGELKMGASKLVIALRTKDFLNRDEMEKKFEKLEIKDRAYHDLETLYELDKVSIRLKDESDKNSNEKKDKNQK